MRLPVHWFELSCLIDNVAAPWPLKCYREIHMISDFSMRHFLIFRKPHFRSGFFLVWQLVPHTESVDGHGNVEGWAEIFWGLGQF